MTTLPAEGTVGFMDNGDRKGWTANNRRAVGVFKGGKWTNGKGRPLTFVPTHWVVMEAEDGA